MHTILVIDEDRAFRDGVARALNEAGLDTLVAADGGAGLALAQEHTPDLVLCALRMTPLDGKAVLEALREEPGTATLPFILMAEAADRAGKPLGADDCLVKPFGIPDLLATVHAQVRKHQALRRHAEEKLATLRASISMALPHELKTPLSSILGGAQVMMMDGDAMSPEEVKEIAALVYESGTRLRRLIENFLFYAQLETLARDAQALARLKHDQICCPGRVVADVARRQAEQRGRSADLVVRRVDRTVAISEPYLEKIVEALLDNAFKFSEPGTPVRVDMLPADEALLIRIGDAGRGMSARQVERLGAYVQVERTLYEQQGAGLGLQIVKRLVQLHEGRFRIASTPGVGTTVEVALQQATSSYGMELLEAAASDVG